MFMLVELGKLKRLVGLSQAEDMTVLTNYELLLITRCNLFLSLILWVNSQNRSAFLCTVVNTKFSC